MDDGLLSSLDKDKFSFACHKDIECFNACCSDLSLVLTPYDILRLKTCLGMASEAFLEKHTVPVKDGQTIFPTVRLKMQDDLKCPFVTPEGCSVYSDRPGACRTYPLARAASASFEGSREKYFMVTESHCRGHGEDKQWSLEEWKGDQGLEEYNEYNDHWMEVITHQVLQNGKISLTDKMIGMFNLACYNTEKFRDFIFDTRFLDMFEVEPSLVEKIKADDMALLKFAMRWLKFSLFGEKTLEIKSGV